MSRKGLLATLCAALFTRNECVDAATAGDGFDWISSPGMGDPLAVPGINSTNGFSMLGALEVAGNPQGSGFDNSWGHDSCVSGSAFNSGSCSGFGDSWSRDPFG